MGTELDQEDFNTILRWFEFRFARDKPEAIPLPDRRVFWKLTFLSEQKAEDDSLKWAEDEADVD